MGTLLRDPFVGSWGGEDDYLISKHEYCRCEALFHTHSSALHSGSLLAININLLLTIKSDSDEIRDVLWPIGRW
jgi:hypothetical protein